MRNSRVYNSASIGSDHSLVLAKFELQAICKKHRTKRVPRKFNVERLFTDFDRAQKYEIRIDGQFEPLIAIPKDEIDIGDFYFRFKQITNEATEDIVKYQTRMLVEGMMPELEQLYERRRSLRLI